MLVLTYEPVLELRLRYANEIPITLTYAPTLEIVLGE